jgi:hypothetical protein
MTLYPALVLNRNAIVPSLAASPYSVFCLSPHSLQV